MAATPDWTRLNDLAERADRLRQEERLAPETFDAIWREGVDAADGDLNALETLMPFAPRGWRRPAADRPRRRNLGPMLLVLLLVLCLPMFYAAYQVKRWQLRQGGAVPTVERVVMVPAVTRLSDG